MGVLIREGMLIGRRVLNRIITVMLIVYITVKITSVVKMLLGI